MIRGRRRRRGSTSYAIAAIERWVNDTSRVDADPDPPARPARATRRRRVSVPARRSSTRSWLMQLAVPHVERLVVDQQPDQLAVGDVEDRLARLGIAVAGLGVGQRALLVERVEVGAGQAVRLALVEVAAQPDVAVGQGEQRLGLRQDVEVEPVSRTAHGSTGNAPSLRPSVAAGPALAVTGLSSSARSVDDDVGAVLAQRLGLCPTRSTPTTKPKPPARPAATPASASSNTAACAGATPSSPAAGQERVRAPACRAGRAPRIVTPSTRTSKRSRRARSTSSTSQRCWRSSETTAAAQPGVAAPPAGSAREPS